MDSEAEEAYRRRCVSAVQRQRQADALEDAPVGTPAGSPLFRETQREEQHMPESLLALIGHLVKNGEQAE